MPNVTILNSQHRQKDARESVQYQETFVGNAITLHTSSIIVTTAHPIQALAVCEQKTKTHRENTLLLRLSTKKQALLASASVFALAGTNNASSLLSSTQQK
ncbi:MAG TPA: hypothetical protein VF026_32700 [Ktedonobacteraceae bacterium]